MSLQLIAGNDGILGRASRAVDENEIAAAKEKVILYVSECKIDYITDNKTGDFVDYLRNRVGEGTELNSYYITMEDNEIIAYKGNSVSFKNKLVTGIVNTDGTIEWIENDNSGISILVTPRSQTEDEVESQTVRIKVESKDWVDWEAQYNWNGSNTQNPEEWKSLTLTGDGTLKEGSATISADDRGDYYLWIKIATNGETKTECFGTYKLGARPKAENIICTMTSTSDNDTKGVITVGSNKVFEEWKLVYRLNSGSYEELEQGKTKTVNVVKNDLVEVKYIKDGETDVIKSVHATELKVGYTLQYDTNGGTGGPSSVTQYDNATFTISSTVPTRTGYTFESWNTSKDGSGTTYTAGDTISITEITTLYAQWSKNTSVEAVSTSYTNLNRKQNLAFEDLFNVTWGDNGTGTISYSVLGKLVYKNKTFGSTTITNASDLELGSYTVACTANDSKTTVTKTKNIVVKNLAETTITNESNANVSAKAIYSEYDLAYFRDLVNAGSTTLNAKQMLDIDLVNVSSKDNGGWNAIGYYNGNQNWGGIGYAGIYEGNSKKITIYSSDISNNKAGGIFGMIIGGTVRNLETEGTIDASLECVGGIVGAIQNGKISNCINNCTISDTTEMYHGGIVGCSANSEIENCINNNTVYGKTSIGGIVGFITNQSNITNCSNSGIVCCYGTEKMVWGGNTGYYYGLVGGIVGYSEYSQVSNCENSGYIYGNSKNMENHGIAAGGIVGWAKNSDISLSRSKGRSIYYNPNQLTDDGGALGGIAGALMSSTINQCFNTSNVSSKFITGEYMQDNSGGIVGYGSAATIKNVYNTGIIGGHSNVGGICGAIDNSVGQNYLYNAYNASENVSETTNVGNIVGYTIGTTGKYCGYIKDTTQIGYNVNSTFSNCTAYTLTQMKTTGSGLLTLLKNGYGSGLWAQSSSKNNGLPYLVNNQP